MKVEVISDKEWYGKPAWRRVRCSAEHMNTSFSAADILRKPELKQCKHSAVVKVDGKPMCRIHGGFAVLLEVVKRGGEF